MHIKLLNVIFFLYVTTVAMPVQNKQADSLPSPVANVQAYGAYSDGTHANETTLAIQAAINSGKPVFLPVGIYLYNNLYIDRDGVTIRGAGKYHSILKQTDSSTVGITVASVNKVEGLSLEDLQLQGDSTAIAGLTIGNEKNYAININLKDLRIIGYVNGDGIRINRSWWFCGSAVSLLNNRNNLHIPTGAVTTTLEFNKNTILSNAYNNGVLIEGNTKTVDQITFRNCTFENNEKEAIKSIAPGVNVLIEDCYFEVNSRSGVGTIFVSGNDKTGYDFATLKVYNSNFHTTEKGYSIVVDKVKQSIVSDNMGLLINGISTTRNSVIQFSNNRGHEAANPSEIYTTLPGNIVGHDYDPATGEWTEYGNRRFQSQPSSSDPKISFVDMHLRSDQTIKPVTIIDPGLGLGASANLGSGSTDIKGNLILTVGSSPKGAGRLIKIEYSKPYVGVPPVVMLTSANAMAAQNFHIYGIWADSDTDGFYIYFQSTPPAGTSFKFNYLVIQ